MAQNLDKNIPQTTQTQSSFDGTVVVVPGEEIPPDLLISEERIDDTFDSKLKEEIATQTLILTALSGENGETITDPDNSQVQQKLSNNLQQQQPTVDLIIAAQQEQAVALKDNNVEDYRQQENNLTFVSQAIAGVEMIAIQQQQQQVSEQSSQQVNNKANILVQQNSLNQDSEKGNNHQNSDNSTNDVNNSGDIFNQQLVAGTLLEDDLAANSPVVLNAIAIKGKNGGVTEIKFDNGSEIQMEQTEVESSAQEENSSQDNDESSLTIDSSALGISSITDPPTTIGEGKIPS